MASNNLLRAVLGGLALVLVSHAPLWAQTDQDEARLQATTASIDKDTASKGSAMQVQALSKQFNVSQSQVQTMRGQKQGWGEITIQLAMAQHLTRTDPKTYPTMDSALTKIQSMRSDTMGWGRIAKDLGFKLGPVVAGAERTRVQLAGQSTQTQTSQSTQTSQLSQERAGQVARQGRVERLDRPQRPDRPERPMRPEIHSHR